LGAYVFEVKWNPDDGDEEVFQISEGRGFQEITTGDATQSN